jgi:hypothetical protein
MRLRENGKAASSRRTPKLRAQLLRDQRYQLGDLHAILLHGVTVAALGLQGNGCQREDARQPHRRCQITPSQGFADVIQLVRLIQAQIRRPAVVRLDEINVNLGHVPSFMDQFRMVACFHCFLFKKSGVQRSGVGR